MSKEYLINEWKLLKLEISSSKSDYEKMKNLSYAKSVYETALTLYHIDLYEIYGGLV